MHSRDCLLQGEVARACIIGARLAWTVEMISSLLIPSRYLHCDQIDMGA
jgi:hypothetical protein